MSSTNQTNYITNNNMINNSQNINNNNKNNNDNNQNNNSYKSNTTVPLPVNLLYANSYLQPNYDQSQVQLQQHHHHQHQQQQQQQQNQQNHHHSHPHHEQQTLNSTPLLQPQHHGQQPQHHPSQLYNHLPQYQSDGTHLPFSNSSSLPNNSLIVNSLRKDNNINNNNNNTNNTNNTNNSSNNNVSYQYTNSNINMNNSNSINSKSNYVNSAIKPYSTNSSLFQPLTSHLPPQSSSSSSASSAQFQIDPSQSVRQSMGIESSFIRMHPPSSLPMGHSSNKYSYTPSYMTSNSKNFNNNYNYNNNNNNNNTSIQIPLTAASTPSFSSLLPTSSNKITVQRQNSLLNQYSNKFQESSNNQLKQSISMIDEGNYRGVKLDFSKIDKLAYEISENMIIPPFKNLKPNSVSLKIQKPKRSKRRSKFTKEQDEIIIKMKNENKTWVEIAESAEIDSYLAARNRYQVLIGQQGGGSNECGPDDVKILKNVVDEGEIEKMKYLTKEFRKCTGKSCTHKDIRELIRYLFWKDPSQFDVNFSYLTELKSLQRLRKEEFGDNQFTVDIDDADDDNNNKNNDFGTANSDSDSKNSIKKEHQSFIGDEADANANAKADVNNNANYVSAR